MLKRLSILIAFTSLMLMSANAEQTCGLGADDCKTPNGAYNIELPERTEQAREIPALIYFHGASLAGPSSLARLRNWRCRPCSWQSGDESPDLAC